MPEPLVTGCDLRTVAIGAWGEFAHDRRRRFHAGRVPEHDARSEQFVTLAEDERGDLESFPDGRFRRATPAIDLRLDIEYRDPAYHLGKLP